MLQCRRETREFAVQRRLARLPADAELQYVNLATSSVSLMRSRYSVSYENLCVLRE